MTLTARYPGRCYKCGGRITPGQQIDWDKATKATRHITCPEKPEPVVYSRPRVDAVKTNRRPGFCELCGIRLEPGKGRLVYCAEDNVCMKHFDEPGYHLYCLDEEACKARREEARRKREAIMAEADALTATITEEEVELKDAKELTFVPRGCSAYESHTWYVLPDGSLAIAFYRPAPLDGWERVALRSTATIEQVQAAKASGALGHVQVR